MKKITLISLFCLSLFTAKSQDYLGLSTGNYAGIQGLSLQPANVADNRYKFELNIFSTSLNFQNNYFGLSRSYFLNNKFSLKEFQSFADFKNKVLTINNTGAQNVYFNLNNRINLPSILLSTGKKSGIAFGLQSRTSLAIDNLNSDFARQIYELWKYTPGQNINVVNKNISVNAMNWFEAGLSYGRVLYDNDKHFVKGGITGKYLGGLSSLNLSADELTIKANNDSLLTFSSPYVNYAHSSTAISSQAVKNFSPDATSWGYDIGFVYEFRGRIDKFKFLKWKSSNQEIVNTTRRDKNKYSAKIGISLLDVGSLKFTSAPLAKDFSANVNSFNLNNVHPKSVADFDTMIATMPGVVFQNSGTQAYSVAMPTALSLQLDLHLLKGFYVNAMAYKPFNALNKNADFRIYTPNYFAVTPRWESRMAGVYVPFILNNHKNATEKISAGATVRVGPVFVGTSNLLTLVKKENIQSADLHAGLKLPIAYGKPSKMNDWFKNMMDKKSSDNTTTNNNTIEKTVIVQDENGNQKEVIVEEKVEKHYNNDQRPIQIIINNYSGNAPQDNKQQIYTITPTGDTIIENKTIIENNAPANKSDIDIYDLQEQINYLKYKLQQKEELINELEKQKSSGQNLDDSKKKIDELKNNLQSGTYPKQYDPNTANQNTLYDENKLFLLRKELFIIDANNKKLDEKIKLAQAENKNLQAQYAGQTDYINKLQILENYWNDLQSTRVQPYKKSDNTIKPQNTYTTTNIEKPNYYNSNTSKTIIDTSNLFTKHDAQNLVSKKELNDLKNEISSLKLKMKEESAPTHKTKRSFVLFGEKNSKNTNPEITKEVVKIVRDTIFIEKPVEKIITKIVHDTIVNTIEKNNTITKVETKIEEKTVLDIKGALLAQPSFNILFDVGQFMIKPIYNEKLKYYAQELKKNPELKILLTGHTDNTGNKAKNKILSNNRTKAVANYLIAKGAKREQLITNAEGDENPIAENNSNIGRSQNRRVELIFTE